MISLFFNLRDGLPLLLNLRLHRFIGVSKQDDLIGRVQGITLALLCSRGGTLRMCKSMFNLLGLPGVARDDSNDF